MTSSHTESLAFKFPKPQGDCNCSICSRVGGEHRSQDVINPPNTFITYKLVRHDTAAKMYYDINDNDNEFNIDSDAHNVWHNSLLKLIKTLRKDKRAAVFNEPVDYVKLNILDYPTIIKHPMDLSTVQNKLENNEYNDPNDVISDIRLIWVNAFTYNKPDNYVHQLAKDMSIRFEQLLQTL